MELVKATPAQKDAAREADRIRRLLSMSREGRRKCGVRLSERELERRLALALVRESQP